MFGLWYLSEAYWLASLGVLMPGQLREGVGTSLRSLASQPTNESRKNKPKEGTEHLGLYFLTCFHSIKAISKY